MLRSSKFDNYFCWKTEFNKLTYSRFFNSNSKLSHYNDEGYYFLILKSPIINERVYFKSQPEKRPKFKSLKIDYDNLDSFLDDLIIPEEWLLSGGLKIDMFSPENAFDMALSPILILRMYFKEGFGLYNRENIYHVKLWKNFNLGAKNYWKKFPDLIEILEKTHYPSHPEFYRKYKFVGYLDYSDMIMPSILISDAFERIEIVRR